MDAKINLEKWFRKAAKECSLGEAAGPPQSVPGGYLHKMYRLQTTKGIYAVKLLNPVIMERPDALDSYNRAEKLECILYENKIPVLPALEIRGKKMQCLEGQYFYVFRWLEAGRIGWKDIREEHCQIAGKMLARIHKIEQKDEPAPDEQCDVNWDEYIRLAQERCPEIYKELSPNRELLYHASEEYNAAMKGAPQITCISDGDMDSKNVLWEGTEPVIIDLESLDYGNPYLEMFRLALSWAGDVVCDLNFDRFHAFIEAYRLEYGKLSADWRVLSGIGYSWLDWLDYNVRRALLLECSSPQERKMGIEQVHETIHRIVYYHSVREEIIVQMSSLYS